MPCHSILPRNTTNLMRTAAGFEIALLGEDTVGTCLPILTTAADCNCRPETVKAQGLGTSLRPPYRGILERRLQESEHSKEDLEQLLGHCNEDSNPRTVNPADLIIPPEVNMPSLLIFSEKEPPLIMGPES